MLKSEDYAVKKLFPHVSNHISGRAEDRQAIEKEISRAISKRKDSRISRSSMGSSAAMGMEFGDGEDAMAQIGIRDFDQDSSRFSETSEYDKVQNTLASPQEYLRNVPSTRDTFASSPIISESFAGTN